MKKGEREKFLKIIGNNLKSWRGVRGYSKKNVADMAGIIPQQYNDYESGKTEPGIVTAQKVADALGITLYDVVSGHELLSEVVEKELNETDYVKNKLTKLGFNVDYAENKKLRITLNDTFAQDFSVQELMDILNKTSFSEMKSMQYKVVLLGILELTLLKKRNEKE